MSIEEKIEEIRQKPEHVRMRYVLLCVAVVMVLVVVVWIVSLTQYLSGDGSSQKSEEDLTEVKNQIGDISDSIKDFSEGTRQNFEEIEAINNNTQKESIESLKKE